MPFQKAVEALAGSSILLQQYRQAVPAVLQQSGADCCDMLHSCILQHFLHVISDTSGSVTSFGLCDALQHAVVVILIMFIFCWPNNFWSRDNALAPTLVQSTDINSRLSWAF